jgi:hypothetical protein
MIAKGTNRGPDYSIRGGAKLRKMGGCALVLGILIASIVYWLGTRSPDLSDDASMAGFYKPQARQMGMLYGQMGVMMDDLCAALKRPGVQAMLILVTTILFSLVCFHLARPAEQIRNPPVSPSPSDRQSPL